MKRKLKELSPYIVFLALVMGVGGFIIATAYNHMDRIEKSYKEVYR